MHSIASELRIQRLVAGDEPVAIMLFAMMASVFEEGEHVEPLERDYVRMLLARSDFFALAAIQGGEVVGGVTGHVLPMTRSRSAELFIYDLAVRPEHQRRGVGRRLVEALTELAQAQGIATSFVAADNDDTHALSFYRALGGEPAPVTMFTFARG